MPHRPVAAAPFAVGVFLSAALGFWAEPLMAQQLLPLLGGAPVVWTTCLAVFQAALLAGYAYAHLLQRAPTLKAQVAIHALVLLVCALGLVGGLTPGLGAPGAGRPVLWLVGSLGLSIAAPFAALSASSPLLQAWLSRARGGTADPYWLYAAGNLGALIALVAYPLVVQPLSHIREQKLYWIIGYCIFFIWIIGSGIWAAHSSPGPVPQAARKPHTRLILMGLWWRRLIWLLLAAAPVSLMTGVSADISTQVSAAPVLWTATLGLYLLSLAIAFRPGGPGRGVFTALIQALAVVAAFAAWGLPGIGLWPTAGLRLAAFFFTALLCGQGLARRRPPARRLTEFYLVLGLGGAIGGAFNAFLAPVIFPGLLEFPLVLLAAGLARSWGDGKPRPLSLGVLGVGLAAAGVAVAAHRVHGLQPVALALMLVTAAAALALRDRARGFLVLCAALWMASLSMAPAQSVLLSKRDAFGTLRVSRQVVPGLGEVRLLSQDGTLQGAQFTDPGYACTPMAYAAPTTPIGQVFRWAQDRGRPLTIGVVGMGVGATAAYVRAGDSLRFFEIDPAVARVAYDPTRFTYLRDCAHGHVDWTPGDGRLSLAKQPTGAFDLLLIDAFAGGALPTHLLTVEALREDLARIKPDGVVILHVSNRDLELASPAAAAAQAAGGYALRQFYRPAPGAPRFYDAAEDVVVVAHDPKVLAALAADPRWRPADPGGVAPWTDDYADVIGAALRGLGHNQAEAKTFAADLTAPPTVQPASGAEAGPGAAADESPD